MPVTRAKLAALVAVAVLAGVTGCTPIEIEYKPAPAMAEAVYDVSLARHPLAPSQVEVIDRDAPPWEYDVIGSIQEAHRDSVPGGRGGRRLRLREAAAQQGCDGVIMNGNVSVFDGRYEYVSPRRRSSDKSRRGHWEPVIELKGEGAECVVRRGYPEAERAEPEEATGWAAVPTDYTFLRAQHY